MLIDNCVAPLAPPLLLQRLLHLSCHPPPFQHARTHTCPPHLCVYPVFRGRPCGYLAGRFNCSDVGRVSHVIRDSREIGVDIRAGGSAICGGGGKKKRKEKRKTLQWRHSIYRWRPVPSWNSPSLSSFFFARHAYAQRFSGKSYASSAVLQAGF